MCRQAPILLHIGTKQPRIAHYVQQYAEQPTILVGTTAYNSRQAEPAGSLPSALNLADQLGLRHLPAPTLRIKNSDKPTINLSTHQGIITRHAADWDYPVELRAPTSCICCHYKAHLTNRTIRPNESHCTGVFLQALLAESLCLTVSYATHGPTQPATATIHHAKWINPELQLLNTQLTSPTSFWHGKQHTSTPDPTCTQPWSPSSHSRTPNHRMAPQCSPRPT